MAKSQSKRRAKRLAKQHKIQDQPVIIKEPKIIEVETLQGETLYFPEKSEMVLAEVMSMIYDFLASPNSGKVDDETYYFGAKKLKEMIDTQIEQESTLIDKNGKVRKDYKFGRRIVAERLEESAQDSINFTAQAFRYNDLPTQRYSLDQLAYIIGGGKISGENLKVSVGLQAETYENWEF